MSTYHHDYAAFDRLVLAAPFMVEEMLVRGERVLARAIENAPYDIEDKDGTHYRDSFTLTGGVREEPTRRAYAQVSNHDMPTAIFVEFGTSTTPRYRILGNALDGASGTIHGRTKRAIYKGTSLALPAPKPRKPKKGTTP